MKTKGFVFQNTGNPKLTTKTQSLNESCRKIERQTNIPPPTKDSKTLTLAVLP